MLKKVQHGKKYDHVLYLQRHCGGFTVVEILVAISLLLLLVFTFTIIFTSSFDGIMTSGRKSEALFAGQQAVDRVSNPESSVETSLQVNFTGLDPLNVSGKLNSYQENFKDDRVVYIEIFVPD